MNELYRRRDFAIPASKLTGRLKDLDASRHQCTQCGNASSVKLIGDDGQMYFEYEKKGGTSGKFEVMGQGNKDCTSNQLKLIVTIETDTGEIKQSVNSFGITDSNASNVGHGYNICIEDSTDEDYNDTYINLVGWLKKG